MKTLLSFLACLTAFVAVTASRPAPAEQPAQQASAAPSPAELERSRELVQLLDNIFKQTIVMVTDKYVHDESDFPAGSAAVLLFQNISDSSENKVRLLDATGEPYDPENTANDAFERQGIDALRAGKPGYEKVVQRDGGSYLRAMTPVPVVMDKCIMCHSHYADAKPGEPIGAISYTIPIK